MSEVDGQGEEDDLGGEGLGDDEDYPVLADDDAGLDAGQSREDTLEDEGGDSLHGPQGSGSHQDHGLSPGGGSLEHGTAEGSSAEVGSSQTPSHRAGGTESVSIVEGIPVGPPPATAGSTGLGSSVAGPGGPGGTSVGANEASGKGAGKGTLDPKPDDRLIKVKGLDRQQLSIDLLMVGCVQSFVDFFYITHRKSAPADPNSAEPETKDVEIPEETLIFLKETLETAESARRGQNYQHCFDSYNTLAEYFEKVPDLKSGMYFYQRCADVASEVDARESVSKAFLNLGICEEKANNWQSAMQFHEKALHIASSADSLPLQIRAASRLTKVYQVLAENCEKEGRQTDATALYERCRDCARLSKDANLEGTACHKLGLSRYKMGQFEPAIELQKQYLDICRMHDDRVGESAARAALADAYEAIGGTQEAIKQLENLLNVASEAGELKAQAGACLNLGILYNGRGDHEKSVELLEQHFDLARQIGDRRLIDSARVVLGMVRGSGKLKSYIDLVNNDLEKLLKWKSKRATLDA